MACRTLILISVAVRCLRTHKRAETEEQLNEYFAGARREFDLPLAPKGTAFQKAVWAEMNKIPYG